MRSTTEAFLDGEIEFSELQRCLDQAAEAEKVIASGGNQLSNGLYVKRYEVEIGEDGTGTLGPTRGDFA